MIVVYLKHYSNRKENLPCLFLTKSDFFSQIIEKFSSSHAVGNI